MGDEGTRERKKKSEREQTRGGSQRTREESSSSRLAPSLALRRIIGDRT